MSALNSHRTPSSSHPSPSSSACAACKYQRRKCTSDCTLAPFFPADKHRQFLNVHRLFGVSNILKTLKSVDENHRQEAMNSIIFQSNIRAQDPAGGCYRIVLDLQRQIEATYNELQNVHNQIAFFRAQFNAAANIQPHLLTSSSADAAADADAIYGLPPPQQYYNNYYFAYDAQQDLQGSHEHSNNGQNVTEDFDDNVNTICIGNEELRQQMLLNLQQKAEREGEMDVRSLADMSETRHVFDISEEHEDTGQNISNGSTITAPCSSMMEVKGDTNLIDQVPEHDLRSAASFFSLKNCDP